jgi:hypothetical protein
VISPTHVQRGRISHTLHRKRGEVKASEGAGVGSSRRPTSLWTAAGFAILSVGKVCEKSVCDLNVIPGQPQVQRLFELTGLLEVLQGLQVRHAEVIGRLESQ